MPPLDFHQARHQLTAALTRRNLILPTDFVAHTLYYLTELQRWNDKINLTAIPTNQWIQRHVLESLAAVAHLHKHGWAIDVGSGAGIPGLILALAVPEIEFILVESRKKKAAFIRQMTVELAIKNAHVIVDRVEHWQPNRTFDFILSKAFADGEQFCALTQHLWSNKTLGLVYVSAPQAARPPNNAYFNFTVAAQLDNDDRASETQLLLIHQKP